MVILGIVTVGVVTISGCWMPLGWPSFTDDADPDQIVVVAESVTLAWDSTGTVVAYYAVYARKFGETEWIPLASDLPKPSFTVTSDHLAFGRYEFAVSSTDVYGMESDLHHSFDNSADPSPWYLDWRDPGVTG